MYLILKKAIMQIPLLVLTICLLIVMSSCLSSSDQTSDPTDLDPEITTLKEDSTKAQPQLTLWNTSSTSHQIGYEFAGLFDDNSDTYWLSSMNTGPNECISVGFIGEGAWISKILIMPVISASSVDYDEAWVYIDDRLHSQVSTDSIEIDTIVNRLDICFEVSSELISSKFQIEDEVVNIESLPDKTHIGLSDLQFFNAEDSLFKVIVPYRTRGRIAPSTNLNPLIVYHAGHLFDGKKEHAWIEGSEGSGSGDSILFQLDTSVCISKMTIWNGLQASDNQFLANARLKSFTFSPLDETLTDTFVIHNSIMQPTNFTLSSNISSSWVLKIIDINSGSITRDLAIGELLFFDCDNKPFIVESDWKERFQNETQSQKEGMILDEYLGRLFYNRVQSTEEEVYIQKSITLQPDGSFSAMYNKNQKQSKITFRLIGYWNIIELNEQLVRLRLAARTLRSDQYEEIGDYLEEELTIKSGIIDISGLLGKFYTE